MREGSRRVRRRPGMPIVGEIRFPSGINACGYFFLLHAIGIGWPGVLLRSFGRLVQTDGTMRRRGSPSTSTRLSVQEFGEDCVFPMCTNERRSYTVDPASTFGQGTDLMAESRPPSISTCRSASNGTERCSLFICGLVRATTVPQLL